MTYDAKIDSENKLDFLFLSPITDTLLHICFRKKVPATPIVSTQVHASPEQRIRSVVGLLFLWDKEPGRESGESLLHRCTVARLLNCDAKARFQSFPTTDGWGNSGKPPFLHGF